MEIAQPHTELGIGIWGWLDKWFVPMLEEHYCADIHEHEVMYILASAQHALKVTPSVPVLSKVPLDSKVPGVSQTYTLEPEVFEVPLVCHFMASGTYYLRVAVMYDYVEKRLVVWVNKQWFILGNSWKDYVKYEDYLPKILHKLIQGG